MDAKPNRKYKDSLFVTYLTEDAKRLIEVYNAVLGTDLPSDSVVKINTLDEVLYHGINNDLSFTVDGTLVVLMEDQATINMNMPLRLLMYVARVYEKLLPSRAVYAEKTVKVPRPEFIVFYTVECHALKRCTPRCARYDGAKAPVPQPTARTRCRTRWSSNSPRRSRTRTRKRFSN